MELSKLGLYQDKLDNIEEQKEIFRRRTYMRNIDEVQEYKFGTMDKMLDSVLNIDTYVKNPPPGTINNIRNVINEIGDAFVKDSTLYCTKTKNFDIRVESSIILGQTIKIWKRSMGDNNKVCLFINKFMGDKDYTGSFMNCFHHDEFKYKDFITNIGLLTHINRMEGSKEKLHLYELFYSKPKIIQINSKHLLDYLDTMFYNSDTNTCIMNTRFKEPGNYNRMTDGIINDCINDINVVNFPVDTYKTKCIQAGKYHIRLEQPQGPFNAIVTIFNTEYQSCSSRALCLVRDDSRNAPDCCFTNLLNYYYYISHIRRLGDNGAPVFYNEIPKKKWYNFNK